MTSDSAGNLIYLGHSLTIRQADAVRACLMKALDAQEAVELDCDDDAEIDVWFVQSLVATYKSFKKFANKKFFMEPMLSPRLSTCLTGVASRGGFTLPFPDKGGPA